MCIWYMSNELACVLEVGLRVTKHKSPDTFEYCAPEPLYPKTWTLHHNPQSSRVREPCAPLSSLLQPHLASKVVRSYGRDLLTCGMFSQWKSILDIFQNQTGQGACWVGIGGARRQPHSLKYRQDYFSRICQAPKTRDGQMFVFHQTESRHLLCSKSRPLWPTKPGCSSG